MTRPPERATFLPRTARWTLVLGSLVAGISQWTFGFEMALGVALGALIGFMNLWLLSKSIDAALARADEHRPTTGRKWALPGVLLLKWPFVLLALGLILWYMPARPEGVAIGLLLSLLAAALAATRAPKRDRAS
jgi:hypothetical protein